MLSQYQTTNQGRETRSLIIAYLTQHPEQEFSRDDLVSQCHLTYDQIRRQTKNLCIEGVISSSISTNGKRLYRLRSSCIGKIGVSTVCLLIAWSVPMGKFVKSKDVPAQVAIERS